ncbi:ATP-binding protein [Synechocystis sp. PCC 7509]|uniref:ATP-binding protein n=1 Tax=Synechocystis sp. PCC 7509 TaxID=927677 RepID=UPI0002AC6A4B|nr:ATP-binding protein [Synechocystis sp. PCC 7509]
MQLKYPQDQDRRLLKTLEASVRRGAALVKQVLSFARGVEGDASGTGEALRAIVQVTHLILEIANIVKETFPKSIELCIDIAPDLSTVSADATQIHQVLMNLVVNARDAMPNGGSLKLSASNLEIEKSYAQMSVEAKVGLYVVITVADTGTGITPEIVEQIFDPFVVITVADTGTGITPEIVEQIFDPFFTTKKVGQGTGLGLSTTLGIIKSHDGFIEICSEVGKSSKFQVYLPAVEQTAIPLIEDPELLMEHGELILVVDDEAAICEIAKAILESYNYRVLTANDGIAALALYAENKHEISLVLLDRMMPKMDGIVAIQTLQKINPQISIVAMSGLSSTEDFAQVTDIGAQGFLSKPFTAQELLKALGNVLVEK